MNLRASRERSAHHEVSAIHRADICPGLSLKGVYTGAYIVMGLTAVSSIWLAFFF